MCRLLLSKLPYPIPFSIVLCVLPYIKTCVNGACAMIYGIDSTFYGVARYQKAPCQYAMWVVCFLRAYKMLKALDKGRTRS